MPVAGARLVRSDRPRLRHPPRSSLLVRLSEPVRQFRRALSARIARAQHRSHNPPREQHNSERSASGKLHFRIIPAPPRLAPHVQAHVWGSKAAAAGDAHLIRRTVPPFLSFVAAAGSGGRVHDSLVQQNGSYGAGRGSVEVPTASCSRRSGVSSTSCQQASLPSTTRAFQIKRSLSSSSSGNPRCDPVV